MHNSTASITARKKRWETGAQIEFSPIHLFFARGLSVQTDLLKNLADLRGPEVIQLLCWVNNDI